MARCVQVFSLMSRLGALTLSPSCSATSWRFSSRGVNKTWSHRDRLPVAVKHGEEQYDGELLEDVEDKIQALLESERKRQKTVKYHILRRKMTPSGPPPRLLTWDAMEQIRYLKQEQPEEWTVERLAEGFSVSPDVIQRVLRAKFVPSPERKEKQDAKVMAGLGQQMLPSGAGVRKDRLKLSGYRTQAMLPSGSTGGALVSVDNQTRVIRGEDSRSLAKSLVPAAALPAQFTANVGKDAAMTRSTEANSANDDEEESWDGRVFTEEELEELIETEKPPPAVQVGKDFFDTEGNFLYRI